MPLQTMCSLYPDESASPSQNRLWEDEKAMHVRHYTNSMMRADREFQRVKSDLAQVSAARPKATCKQSLPADICCLAAEPRECGVHHV